MPTIHRRALLVAVTMLGPIAISMPAGAGGRGGGGGGEPGSGLPPQYYFGLAHDPMGAATLALDPAGHLVLDNLGSSGNDGVAIHLSEPSPAGALTPDWVGEIDFGPSGGLPAGRVVRVSVRDSLGNAAAQLLVSETGGGHATLGFDQTLCPACPVTVELRLAGVVVQSSTVAAPYPPALVSGDIGSQGSDGVTFVARRKKVFVNQFDVDIASRLPSPRLLQVTGGLPPANADEVILRLNGLPPGTRYIDSMSITSNGGPVMVHDESLLKRSRAPNDASAVASLHAEGASHMIGGGDLDGDGRPDVVVSNIGSSGQDGVRIKRFGIGGESAPSPPLGRVAASCDWGDAGALADGSVLRFIVGNDAPGLEYYAMAITGQASGQGAVSFEYCAACCPCTIVVQAVHNGVVVDQVTPVHPTDTLAVGNIGSQGSENGTLNAYRQTVLRPNGTFVDSLVLEVHNPVASSFTLAGSSPVTADRVRVRVTPTDGTIIPFTQASVRASNVVIGFTLADTTADLVSVTAMTAQGLPVSPLGDATLALNADGSLSVSGLDLPDPDDDDDGVEFDCDAAQGAGINVHFASGLPTTGLVDVSYRAKTGKTGRARFFDDDSDGDEELRVQQDICPTCPLQVDLLLNGQVVRSAVFPPPYPSALVENALASSAGGVSHRFIWNTAADLGGGGGGGGTLQLRVHNPVPVLMTLWGRAPADADSIRVTLNGLPPGVPVDDLATLRVTGSGMPGVTIDQAGLFKDGRYILRAGVPLMAGRKRVSTIGFESLALHVANIGSSGQDGVAIAGEDDDCDGEADDELERAASLVPIALAATSGAAVSSSLRIAGGTTLDTSLTMAPGGGGGGGHAINWDFGGSTTLTHHAQVVLGGTVALEASNVSGPLVASVPAGSVLAGGSVSRALEGTPLVWSPRSNLRFQSPVMITLSTGLSAMGNELRVIGENPSAAVQGVATMGLTASNLPGNAMTLLSITGVPIDTCPADIDGTDSVVDVNDLLMVINGWGACPAPCPPSCAADIAPDCAVNVDDLLAVINAWGPCP